MRVMGRSYPTSMADLSHLTESSEVDTQSQSHDDHLGIPQPDDDSIFVGKLEGQNFKYVIRILKSITIRKLACFHATERGLKVISQERGYFQMTAYLQKDIFQYFRCIEKEVFFQISLDVLLNCLQMFVEVTGEATTGQFAYKGEGHSLCVQLEQMGHYTQCDIRTTTVPLLVEVQFLAEQLLSRIICKSDCVKDGLQSLLAFPSASLEVHVTKEAPYFLLRTVSDAVTSEVSISKDSDYVENFTCMNDTSFSYRSALLKASMKPLSISEKTSIRIDNTGVMALQFMIRNEEDAISFVEIYCVPEDEPHEDD